MKVNSPKKILFNSLIYGLLSLLQKPIAFVILLINSHFLLKAEFDKVVLVLPLVELFSRIYHLGLPNAGTRLTVKYAQDKRELHRLWSTLFILVLLIGICGFILLLGFHKWILDPFIKDLEFFPYLFLASLCSIFSALYMLYQQQYQANHQAKKFSVRIISFNAFYLISIIIFVSYLNQAALGVVYAFTLANALLAAKALYSNFTRGRIVFCFSKAKEALKYGLPLLPHNISAWFMNLVDRYFLSFYVAAEVGGFSIAFQIAMLIDTLTMGVYQAFQPWFFALFEKKSEKTEGVYKFVAFTAILYAFCALLLASFSKEVFALCLPSYYHDAWKFVPLLACAQVIRGNYLFYLTALLSRSSIIVSFITLSTALFNILLNYQLIPAFGAMGAAFSAFITQHIIGGLCLFFSKGLYEVSFKFRRVAGVVYLFFALTLLNLYPHSLSFWDFFILKCVLICLITSGLYFFYKQELYVMWKKLKKTA